MTMASVQHQCVNSREKWTGADTVPLFPFVALLKVFYKMMIFFLFSFDAVKSCNDATLCLSVFE